MRTTITDRKIATFDTNWDITGFTADITSANDYFPFGSSMPGRSYNSGEYRYGFNGMEKDDEVKGSGNSLDFGARIYDSRIGRWLSTDAFASSYPGYSTYNFALNTPITAVDPDGNLVIFIGGLRASQGIGDQRMPSTGERKSFQRGIYQYGKYSGALRSYWRNDGDPNSFGRNVDMANKFLDRIGDYNAFFASGSSDWTSNADQRYGEGQKKAQQFHAMVKKGEITLADGETIKIISHSQGGAHAEGFANELLSYKDNAGNPLYIIEVIYNITPHQPGDVSHIKGVRGVQYSHPDDAVSSRSILPNGGSSLQRMQGDGEYVESQELQRKGLFGLKNRGQHNVTDNDQIFDIPSGEKGYVAPRQDK